MANEQKHGPSFSNGDRLQENSYTFILENGRWYLFEPDHEKQGLSKGDLEMVDGSQKILHLLANGNRTMSLRFSTEPFEGANRLELIENCDEQKGGGIYLLETLDGKEVGSMMWICDLALLVFGDTPAHIYFKALDPAAEARPK